MLRSVYQWEEETPRRREAAPLLILLSAWAVYFWRVLTPNPADQVSLPQGDFSGQFLAFGAYQARRMLAGQIPLWNPFNNAGHPFLADTQSAVFYPVRLIVIFASHFTGGWSYNALQVEVILHFLIASILAYAFVRTITKSRLAGIVSALTLAYGGYLTGYPPLQVAVLEAGVWLPLCLLGIHKASQWTFPDSTATWRPAWLAASGLGLGISLLAGHPQTSLFMTYVTMAYLVHRAVTRRIGWRSTLVAAVLVFGTGYALAAIQVLPGLEYAGLTTRTDIGFDARAGGFPFSDVVTLLLPNVFTVWAPLYSGVSALVLASIAVWSRQPSARFWVVVSFVALGISFGGATVIYHLAYFGIPGLALFRGQERAAFVIAHAVSILAGLGVTAIRVQPGVSSRLARILRVIVMVAWGLAVETLVARVVFPAIDMSDFVQASFLLAILLSLNWLLFRIPAQIVHSSRFWAAALVALITLDLFSTRARSDWEAVPASHRLLLSDLVPVVAADDTLFRVDGRLGLGENYGTLVGIQDIRGTSPLRLKSLQSYLELPQFRMHQLLAVKYVFTDWQQLEVPSSVVADATIGTTHALLHEIADPTPRAWMTYRVMQTADETQAIGWMSDPSFDPRSTAILSVAPGVAMPTSLPSGESVRVTKYAPESISLDVSTPTAGVLVLSEMDYPGWEASIDGQPIEVLKADGALRGLPIRAGQHLVEFNYQPLSVTVGGSISIAAVLAIVGITVSSDRLLRHVRTSLRAERHDAQTHV